jgi:hypothetical protein
MSDINYPAYTEREIRGITPDFETKGAFLPVDKGYGLEAAKHNIGTLMNKAKIGLTTYTVASEETLPEDLDNYDFKSFHEAMLWVESLELRTITRVKLKLADGTHLAKFEQERYDAGAYNSIGCLYNIEVHTDLDGNNSDTSAVVVQSDPNDPNIADIGLGIFAGAVSSHYITLKNSHSGDRIDFIYTIAPLFISDTNFIGLKIYVPSKSFFLASVFENCQIYLIRPFNTDVFFNQCQFNNTASGTALTCQTRCVMQSCTFSGNANDTNIPIDEIQYDGSFISTGTKQMTFKA